MPAAPGKPRLDAVASAQDVTSVRSSRRQFLLALGAGTASAATLTAIPANAIPAASPPVADASDGGYRETEHVRNYYRTARL